MNSVFLVEKTCMIMGDRMLILQEADKQLDIIVEFWFKTKAPFL